MSQTQNTKRLQNVTVPNNVIGGILVLLLRGDNFDKAVEVMSMLIQSPHLIVGTVTTECINEIFELSLAQAHVPAIFVSAQLIRYYTLSASADRLIYNVRSVLPSDAPGIRYLVQPRRRRSNGQKIVQDRAAYGRPREHFN